MQVGQVPVCLKREIDGFALNRVQAAIIAESWRLVKVSVAISSSVQFKNIPSKLLAGQLRGTRVCIYVYVLFF